MQARTVWRNGDACEPAPAPVTYTHGADGPLISLRASGGKSQDGQTMKCANPK